MITRRNFLIGSGAVAVATSIAISAPAPTFSASHYAPWRRFIATPEIDAMINRLVATSSMDVLDDLSAASWSAYRTMTYPRLWFGVNWDYTDRDVFSRGRRFLDDEDYFSALLANGDQIFVDASPENYALIEALPQRAGLSRRDYLRVVDVICEGLMPVSKDRSKRVLYVKFNPTGHTYREVSYGDQFRL